MRLKIVVYLIHFYKKIKVKQIVESDEQVLPTRGTKA
jgi:hypothetical protein